MNSKKITIMDVARMAGVSKGTVDRVIHNRGEVSQESFDKVMEVISRLNYKPNVYASLLASNRRYRFACLIPAFAPGGFWEIIDNGIRRAYDLNRDLNIKIDTVYYDQFDVGAFNRACSDILANLPDAVMIAPVFRKEAEAFTAQLSRHSIPFVYIESRIENSPYLAYYGMPAFESGRLSARLLMKCTGAGEAVCFRMRRGKDAHSNTASGRLEGFKNYLDSYHPECKLYIEYLEPRECEENIAILDRFFRDHPDLDHIVTFNSRAFIIGDYLKMRGMDGKTLIGFDPLERNVKSMKDGYIEYIIAQKGTTQAFLGIKALCDLLIFKTRPPARDNYMSMDILTAENVDFYIDLR